MASGDPALGQRVTPQGRFDRTVIRLERANSNPAWTASIALTGLAALADLAADMEPDNPEASFDLLADAAGRLAALQASDRLLSKMVEAWRSEVVAKLNSDPLQFRVIAIKAAEAQIRRLQADRSRD
ncbi:MAG: hypothetical protein QNJ84_10270 [Alphaproteobacteria bacterium]|nr:hypothetical protein [Alphaproteobacteria bacterium]